MSLHSNDFTDIEEADFLLVLLGDTFWTFFPKQFLL